ncbi:MAG: helix-turn-helix domain-containing protein [Patescibacteria group bacterium]
MDKNTRIDHVNMRRIANVLENFSKEINCSYEELVSKNRRSDMVRARATLTLACLKEGFSYSSIAKFLNRDHTTIMYLANAYKDDFSIRRIVAEKPIKKILKPIKEPREIEPGVRVPLNHSIYNEVYIKFQARCAVCNFDEVTEVHHIIPVKLGGSNDIENLILLCPNHHKLADKGMLNIKDIPNSSTPST